jgi:hypothetical protein
MNNIKHTFKAVKFTFLLLVIFSFTLQAQELDTILKRLSKEYHFTYKTMKTGDFFKEKYLLEVEQPVNHNEPGGQKFTQRVFLCHKGFDNPVVFVTEGYAANYAENPNYVNELSPILDANQIVVEHRYFAKSTPKPVDWSQLTVYNAATDHHRIVEILKNIYKAKWVSTGISKGGQTAIYFRYFYPGDVDVSVPYVAPLNFAVADKRVYRFLQSVGDSACRDNIYKYQLMMLQNKEKFLPAFKKLTKKRKLTYRMGYEKAYELLVLEYSFAFWQWGSFDCNSFPMFPDSAEVMLKQLDKVAGFDWVSDQGIEKLQPFFYQALAEIGFYGYNIEPFKEYISFTENPDFEFTAPEGVTVVYDPVPMQKVDCFVRHEAKNMIFIYGEYDAWSSTSVNLTYNSDNLKIVKPKGSHRTRINNLPEKQKELVISTLKEWMEVEK